MKSGMKYYPPIPSLKPANIMYEPDGDKYKEENRLWQGCPSIVKTKSGRIWAAWFTGGVKEPGYGNFNLVWYSDDEGETWRKNYIVIEADEEHYDRATDINLWLDPDDNLYVTYVQMRFMDVLLPVDQIWCFYDGIFGSWVMKCSDPDAENPVFEAPVRWCDGYCRNRPTVLSNGDWFLPAYDWVLPEHGKSDSFLGRGKGTYNFHFRISHDKGKTWGLVVGPEKELLHSFDEGMMVEGQDGKWHVYLRISARNGIWYTVSEDKGETWTPIVNTGIASAETRVFVRRLSSGNVLMVHSGPGRNGMYARLSEDDCKTWSEPLVLDDRRSVSYPDGMEDENGYIYMAYDRERYEAREILYARFTEEDIKAKSFVSEGSFNKKIISKLTSKRDD